MTACVPFRQCYIALYACFYLYLFVTHKFCIFLEILRALLSLVILHILRAVGAEVGIAFTKY